MNAYETIDNQEDETCKIDLEHEALKKKLSDRKYLKRQIAANGIIKYTKDDEDYEEAKDYPYSSAKAHIHCVKDEILREALFEGRQMKDYIELMTASIKKKR